MSSIYHVYIYNMLWCKRNCPPHVSRLAFVLCGRLVNVASFLQIQATVLRTIATHLPGRHIFFMKMPTSGRWRQIFYFFFFSKLFMYLLSSAVYIIHIPEICLARHWRSLWLSASISVRIFLFRPPESTCDAEILIMGSKCTRQSRM